MLWRSIEPRPLELLAFLAGEVGVPMLLVALLCLGDASRAIASWLPPPLVGLVWASVFGVDLLALMVEQRSPWLLNLPSWLGARTRSSRCSRSHPGCSRGGRSSGWAARSPGPMRANGCRS
jgi:hypothetical protein